MLIRINGSISRHKCSQECVEAFLRAIPLRTLLDVAASNPSPEHLQTAIHEALDQGLVRVSALDLALAAAPGDVRRSFEADGIA